MQLKNINMLGQGMIIKSHKVKMNDLGSVKDNALLEFKKVGFIEN